jgi:hypothetical protein
MEVSMLPPPMSTFTWAATAPFFSSTTLPLMTLRALIFMDASPPGLGRRVVARYARAIRGR